MFTSFMPRGAAAIFTLALTLTGCGRDGDGDPTVSAAADLQRSLEMDGVLDLLGPGGGSAALGPSKGMPAGLACDESPELVTSSVCGHDFAAEAHYGWSECLIDHPGDRPDVTTTGKLDLVRNIVGEPDCASPLSLEESASFELSLALPQGRSVAMSGTFSALSERDLAAGSFTRTTTLAATRSLFDEDGELQRTIELAGELEISVTFDDAGPVRSVDGTLTITHGDEDDDATISLAGIVHRPLSDCAWPSAGTLVRTLPDATSHNLSFGPECGAATLDGEVVDLDDLQQGSHRRRHRGGRPF